MKTEKCEKCGETCERTFGKNEVPFCDKCLAGFREDEKAERDSIPAEGPERDAYNNL